MSFAVNVSPHTYSQIQDSSVLSYENINSSRPSSSCLPSLLHSKLQLAFGICSPSTQQGINPSPTALTGQSINRKLTTVKPFKFIKPTHKAMLLPTSSFPSCFNSVSSL